MIISHHFQFPPNNSRSGNFLPEFDLGKGDDVGLSGPDSQMQLAQN